MWALLENLFPSWVLYTVGGLFILAAICGLAAKLIAVRREHLLLASLKAEGDKSFISQFSERELNSARAGYIEPLCQTSDPADYDSHETIADIREPIFSYIKRAVINNKERTFNIILSDTGVGKTTFCLNLYVWIRKNYPTQKVRLYSLSGEAPVSRIRSDVDKVNSIIILDALDEEAGAIEDGRGRLDEILDECKEYGHVIITCRSQFFISDDAIPLYTKIEKIIPRAISQGRSYHLVRSYLSPFTAEQIKKYISKHFPIYNPLKLRSRMRAFELVQTIPDLAYRPMLLEKLPEMVRSKIHSREIWEMYRALVHGWADREARWIEPSVLMEISRHLAIYVYANSKENGGRISESELERVAMEVNPDRQEWQHLNARSLLNRDSVGKIKFAHRSIMEFLVVEAAIGGNYRSLDFRWSDFMKQLFVSWGYSNETPDSLRRAISLLSDIRSKENVLPLSDVWVLPPLNGLPDFKRASPVRSFVGKVHRPAPLNWRASNIEIHDSSYGYAIYDHEYNLFWRLHKEALDVPPTSMGLMINLEKTGPIQSLPSYDQVIRLIEGLHACGRDEIISDGDVFYIGDRRNDKEHLLVGIGASRIMAVHTELDAARTVSSTERKISCFSTGIRFDLRFSSLISVRQLWTVEKSSLDADVAIVSTLGEEN